MLNTKCFAPFLYANNDPLDAAELSFGASAGNSTFVVQTYEIGRLDLCVRPQRILLWSGVARNAICCTADVVARVWQCLCVCVRACVLLFTICKAYVHKHVRPQKSRF